MIPLLKLPIVYKFQIYNDADIIGHVATVRVLSLYLKCVQRRRLRVHKNLMISRNPN